MTDKNHYTYLIVYKENFYYYGVRTCKIEPENDLGIKYFSSSKLIKELLSKESIDDFKFIIRKKFKTREKALKCEEKILRKFDVLNNMNWLNKAINSNFSFVKSDRMKGKKHTEESKKKISLRGKDRKHSDATKNKMSIKQKGRCLSTDHIVNLKKYKKTDIHKKNLSESLLNYYKINGTDSLKKTKNIKRKKQKNCHMWVTNGIESKMIKKTDSIPSGWYRGRKT